MQENIIIVLKHRIYILRLYNTIFFLFLINQYRIVALNKRHILITELVLNKTFRCKNTMFIPSTFPFLMKLG